VICPLFGSDNPGLRGPGLGGWSPEGWTMQTRSSPREWPMPPWDDRTGPWEAAPSKTTATAVEAKEVVLCKVKVLAFSPLPHHIEVVLVRYSADIRQ